MSIKKEKLLRIDFKGVKMRILNLKLQNFRNYDQLNIEFNPCKNLIIGKNTMGKTNIVEAIYVLAFTKSFRGSKDNILINFGCDHARIEGTVENNGKNDYKVILNGVDKKVFINNNPVSRLMDYLSHINIVLFTSEDLKLINDTPNTRRKLINIELSQFSNDYLKTLTIYNKVLKQRNAYLKTLYTNGLASKDYLDILTNQLVNLGLKIHKYRADFIEEINVFLEKNFYKITNEEGLHLRYKSDYSNKSVEDILKMHKKEVERDIVLGKTNSGVHLDDYDFIRDERNLRDFGSQGEQKNAIISLKMAEIDIFRDKLGVEPILILDDLFSDLDKSKINNILTFLNDDIQTFITTTELNKISKHLKENSKIIKISNGKVVERNN